LLRREYAMYSDNPFGDFRRECEAILAQALRICYPEIALSDTNLVQRASSSMEKPSNPQHGQLASSLCFELAKTLKQKPQAIANFLVEAANKDAFALVEKVEAAGAGYINFHINFNAFSKLTLESISSLNNEYGFMKTTSPTNMIVEHTSVNPLHPIHIGQARNPMLGDTLARILRKRGHKVACHYYIDDVGRQSSVVAYGYKKLGEPLPSEKPDHFIGKIYTITSCLVEISRLKKLLSEARCLPEETSQLNKELAEWVSVAAELEVKYPLLFRGLLEKISKDADPEEEINKLNRAYEEGEPHAKELIRRVSELCLQGFRQTQQRVGVSYDSWDWESDFVWGGKVAEVLQQLENTPYVRREAEVLEFEAEKAAQALNLKRKLGLADDHEIPSLTLVRADGTTLYTTRDIAYTLWKFTRAKKVINVIGMEQSLAQLQLKVALYALGYGQLADNLVHFAYNLVSMPGYKMSSRRGHYVTFDEVLDEAIERAYQEVSKRSPSLSEKEKREIACFVGTGAVRYALTDVDPSKPVLFTWERVLNFETNSAPYVQYTHARACSILRKANRKPEKPGYALLVEALERELVLHLSSFPEVFIEAAEFLKPNLVADYANALADKFNTFYNAYPVIKAGSQELSDARIMLTQATKIVLSNALNLLGVFAPEKM